MDTKNQNECCSLDSKRRRKIIGGIILIVGIAVILFAAAAAAKISAREISSPSLTSSQNAVPANMMYSSYDDSRQFVLPQDASRRGDIVMQVSDANNLLKNISNVANAQAGTIYATFTTYSQSRGTNGFVVLQIDENQFDSTFQVLKSLGGNVVQESSKKIPRFNDVYPMPVAVSEPSETSVSGKQAKEDTSEDENTDKEDEKPAPNVQPSIIKQGKGYIKVNFFEGENPKIMMQGRSYNQNSFWSGYQGLGMRNNLWVVLGIKSIAVIILIAIIVILTSRLIQHARQRKETRKRPTVHIVRQQKKMRPRVLKVAKKK